MTSGMLSPTRNMKRNETPVEARWGDAQPFGDGAQGLALVHARVYDFQIRGLGKHRPQLRKGGAQRFAQGEQHIVVAQAQQFQGRARDPLRKRQNGLRPVIAHAPLVFVADGGDAFLIIEPPFGETLNKACGCLRTIR